VDDPVAGQPGEERAHDAAGEQDETGPAPARVRRAGRAEQDQQGQRVEQVRDRPPGDERRQQEARRQEQEDQAEAVP
jgi:hypothetical protein